jgi:GNAT superfamily N-acetyltransferase
VSEPLVLAVLASADTYDLRRRVLRDDDPSAEVRFDSDDRAGAFHLGLRTSSGEVVAVASFTPTEWPPHGKEWRADPGPAPWQLRGMAVAAVWQGQGWGTVLLIDGVARVRGRGGSVLWANARDSALGFYRGHGWQIVGDGFVTDIGVPHHFAVVSW